MLIRPNTCILPKQIIIYCDTQIDLTAKYFLIEITQKLVKQNCFTVIVEKRDPNTSATLERSPQVPCAQ